MPEKKPTRNAEYVRPRRASRQLVRRSRWIVLRKTDSVTNPSRARSVYELGESVAARRDLLQRIFLLVDAVTGGIPSQPPLEHQVKLRTSGEIIYRVKTDSDVAYQEARRSISHDLDHLTVEEFNEQYGLKREVEKDGA